MSLLREFRKQLDCIRPGMTLSMAAPAGSWAYQYIALPTIQHLLNHFNLMTYDFDGPGNNATGFVAPLYASPLRSGPNE
jgi:chitinase